MKSAGQQRLRTGTGTMGALTNTVRTPTDKSVWGIRSLLECHRESNRLHQAHMHKQYSLLDTKFYYTCHFGPPGKYL